MGKIKIYTLIILLFVISIHVLAASNNSNETTNNTAITVSIVTSTVALIGTIIN